MARLREVPGLPATLAVTIAAFAGWSLLLAVVPLALSLAGGSDALAGAGTAVFMGATVLAQIGAPRALHAWGYRPTLALGCALLGLPALVLVATIAPVPTLVVSAVRGIGFGLLTVTGSALVAELVPPRLLGRASGTFGAVVAGPQIVALPGGVALAQAWSTTPVFLLGALIPTLAAAGAALVPPVRTHPAPDESGTRVSPRALAVPLLALLVVAAAFGGITSLLPIAIPSDARAATVALAVFSAATVVGRYTSGVVANRVGAGRQLLPALTFAVIGLTLVAFAVRSPVAAVVLAIGAPASVRVSECARTTASSPSSTAPIHTSAAARAPRGTSRSTAARARAPWRWACSRPASATRGRSRRRQ